MVLRNSERRRLTRTIVWDALAASGSVAIAAGLGQWSSAAACIWLGLCLLTVGLLGARNAVRR